MINHLDAIIGAMIASAVLGGALVYVRSLPGMRPGLGWWAAGFALNALRLAIYLVVPPVGQGAGFFLAEYLQAVQSVLLLAGTLAFLGRDMPTRALAAACLAVGAWAALGAFVIRDFVVTTVPLYLATGLVLMASGVMLLRMPGESRRPGRIIAGLSLVLWGVHKMNFPFLRTVEGFAPWGFMIAQTLALTAALGIIVMALRALQRQGEKEAAERLAAEQARGEIEAFHRAAFRTSPDAVILSRLADGVYVDVNEGFTELTGFAREEAIGRTAVDIGLWTDTTDRERLMAALGEQGQVSNFKAVLRHKAGHTGTALISARVLTVGGVPHLLTIGRDITRLQEAEDALQRSEALYRTAFRTSPDAINLNRLEDGLYVDVNEGFTEMSGYGRDEVVGKTSAEIAIWTDIADRERLVAGLKADGQVSNLRAVFRRKDGSTATALMSARVLSIGGVPHILSITRDITRLRQAEEALQRSEAQLRSVIEAAPVAIILKDVRGRFQVANRTFRDWHGLHGDDIAGRTAFDLYDRETAEAIARRDDRTMAEGTLSPFEADITYPDGVARTVSVFRFPVHDADGTVTGNGAILADVTAERRAEAAQRESEARLRSVVEAAPVAILLKDVQGRIQVANRTFRDWHGLGGEDLTGRTAFDLYDRELAEDITRRDNRVAAGGAIPPFEMDRTYPDGTKRTIAIHHFPVDDADGAVVGTGAIVTDVTGQKLAEAARIESERNLRAVLDAAPVAIILKDLRGRYQTVNRTFLSWNRRTAESLIGKTPFDLYDRETAEAIAERDERTVAEGTLPHVEVEHAYPDGVKRNVMVLRFPVHGTDGAVAGTGAIIADRTAEKRAEAWLRRMSQSVEQSPLGIVILDAETRIEYVNPSFTRETGYTLDDVRGRPGHVQNADGPDSPSDRRIKAALKAGRDWRGEVRHRRKSGEVYWASLLISPVKDDDGKVIAYVGISEDITERRKVADHLRQAQKMEAVGQLTGGVAHDFNNILSVVQLNAEVLAEDIEGHAASGSVTRILRAVRRAAELTERLLTFSRRQDLLPEVVDLGAAVRDTADLLGRSLGETIAVSLDVDLDTPLVTIDRGQFENALLNLAINARDAMPGGGSLTIGIGRGRPAAAAGDADAAADYACVTVADSGTGMPPEVAERIFEPFFTTKAKGQGTGLGLSMVYGFVRQSGGDIEVDSAPGEGTTFRLYFPAAKQAAGADPAAGEAAGGDAAGELPPLVILLAEDDADVRGSTRAILHGCGHAVVQAADGIEALERLRETPEVDLLLTDVVMPGMTGRDLADAAWADRPGLKVLFTSGYAAGVLSSDDLEPGRSAFLAKPYTKESLLGALSVLWFAPSPAEPRRKKRPRQTA